MLCRNKFCKILGLANKTFKAINISLPNYQVPTGMNYRTIHSAGDLFKIMLLVLAKQAWPVYLMWYYESTLFADDHEKNECRSQIAIRWCKTVSWKNGVDLGIYQRLFFCLQRLLQYVDILSGIWFCITFRATIGSWK